MHRGDLVEIRSASEILATLDEQGKLGGLPFMPEMAAYCGQRFRVNRRADKVCDTVMYTGSRLVPDAVLLDDVRCDGSGHDGCQAGCRIFWKEAWLRKVAPDTPAVGPSPGQDIQALVARVAPATRMAAERKGKPVIQYRCQNTDILNYSQYQYVWDPRPYIRQFTNGNVTFLHFLRVTARAYVTEVMRKLRLIAEVHLPGTAKPDEQFPVLNLQPGELVRVKSKEEIAKTLTPDGKYRGMWFDREMMPYCGKVFRVRCRVERFIDERGGNNRMVKPRIPVVILDGAVCSGDQSICRWMCPRAVFPYWSESWLERLEPQSATAGEPARTAAE